MSAAILSFTEPIHTNFSDNGISVSEQVLLRKLDCLASHPGEVKHFAALYRATTLEAIRFFAQHHESSRLFIRRLEWRFAEHFFRAVQGDSESNHYPPHWKPYFENTSLSPLQYCLLGANAHINGDIWRSLTETFSFEEIQAHYRAFLDYEKGLWPTYLALYEYGRRHHPLIQWLHIASLGFSRNLGFSLLRHWRKRQVKLALLYYQSPSLFQKKQKKLERRMKWIEWMIVKLIR
jgi:hypothetical protein